MLRALLLLLLLAPLASAAPEQVRLGLPSSDPAHEASVTWVDMTQEDAPAVTLRTPDGPKTFSATLQTGPSLGNVYEAKLAGLAPATSYVYTVGDRTFALETAPEGPANFTFVAVGDMGVSAAAQATVDAIETLAPSFVLHSGDISYAESRQNEWVQWFTMTEPLAAERPWITALGNHETYSASSLMEAPAAVAPQARVVSPVELAYYHERFALPGNELWYSFDWGGAHFVCLDTFSAADIPADELTWLDADLAAHGNATWTIAYLHEPPYSSGTSHGSSARVQQALVPILEKHGVDLVLAGHEHNYERTWPMRAGEPVAKADVTQKGNGTVYLVSGGGGESTYPFGEPGQFSAAHVEAYHVTLITVTPDAIAGRYVGTDTKAFADAFRIERPAPAPAAPAPTQQPTPAPALALVLVALVAGAALRRARYHG